MMVIPFVALWLLSCIGIAILRVKTWYPGPYAFVTFLQYFSIIIGMIGLWAIYDVVMKNRLPSAKWVNLFSYSFFMYAFHEPVLTIAKKALFYYSDKSNGSLLLIFFLSPLSTIALAIITGKLLQRVLPSLYSTITGGR